ncbi:hypothetical protein H4Q26_002351 [Puccinia striiformis f. sp. tritici PST-130]|nr:hypothetical protein H4Q26_002351 [Puccinia striiformis f. sp. tritici PST-130]
MPAMDTTIDTDYTPCSIEFCPVQSQSKTFLGSCGFYQTEQKKDQEASESPEVERNGRCILFETSLEDDRIVYHQLQSFDTPAILDQRWTQDPQQPILITADALGGLTSYKLSLPIDNSPRLDRIHSFACCPPEESTLCLSLDISDKKYRASTAKIVCSLSNGQIVLLTQHPTTMNEEHRWNAHQFEPWTCGFDYWQPETILTGGDDCKLKVWDTRNSFVQPVLTNKQFKFDGGVTAIRSHHLREHLFAVGSYDSNLRIFDKRNFTNPVMKEECGGGIWRIKWDEVNPERVLLATMHGGFKVLQISDNEPYQSSEEGEEKSPRYPTLNASVISSFSHRSDLAYGADWAPKISSSVNSSSPHPSLVAGCSFYDRAIHFWTLD